LTKLKEDVKTQSELLKKEVFKNKIKNYALIALLATCIVEGVFILIK
jgi:hypothetical protein